MALLNEKGIRVHARFHKRKASAHARLENDCEERVSRKRKRTDRSDCYDSADDEGKLEDLPRYANWKGEDPNQVHFLLPLKTKFGIVHQSSVLKGQANELPDSDEEIKEPQQASRSPQMSQTMPQIAAETEISPVLTVAQLYARRQNKLDEKKTAIAELSTQIISNPEENIGMLKKLRSLCVEKDTDVAVTVRKYAMTSLTAVFKDITPSYRIQDWKEIDKGVKLSKDVLKLRQFEQLLLSNYRLFLELLDKTIQIGFKEITLSLQKSKKSGFVLLEDGEKILPSSLQGLAEVALACLCDLVVSLSHFNFCNNILAILVPRMNSKALDGKVSRLCCATMGRLFQNDIVGEVSLEVVQLITKMVKGKNYKANPEILRTFLHLQLQHVGEQVGAQGSYNSIESKMKKKDIKNKILKMSKGQRKRLKEEKKLDQELRETEAVERTEKKSKFQTETIKLVFLTYFRILKNATHSPLLSPVLEGLAKFAHLINIDFFQDLMSVLHSLAEVGSLTNRECMLCVLTAFEILSGQGAALNIDSRQFYAQLYETILQLDTFSKKEDIILAVDCLDKMMRKRREVSTLRVFGFVKRLSMISLQLVPGAALAILATIRKFMTTYSQCQQLLDTECIVGELFRPDVSDPEMSHANATVLWELSLQQRHYEPTVKTFATHLLLGAPSQGKGSLQAELARKTCSELLGDSEVCSLTNPVYPHPSHKARSKQKSLYYMDRGIKNQLIQRALISEMESSIDFVFVE